ncbi:Pkinase_Tyr domain-containing protein [Cephalotus follicularis]|uniref:Pkinase_Tyr domain-containing protein n=1 Tax=Cephalotus follicularis TaxID=3775 RepID=A0A1Q3BFK0_CEPFO|nr:Pkinase_Tyr domain-containing protein [Cephalotus follicularis]
MGFISCNAESAIATCDPYNWDRKKKEKTTTTIDKNPIKIREFSYNELVIATDSFSADSFLGKGSHGSVYKALLDDGKLIAAVKRNTTITPAENEIEILSRVNNPRLVNLLGFSSPQDNKQNQLIVVEYMPNGSLLDLLHTTTRPPGWTRRIRFALQIAKAVHSLHSGNPPVIHRDIKSSNVLIDENYKARLGDFGLALRGHVEDVRVNCTPPAGTLGYLDPGYLSPGDVSAKSDVFSFGILLLEIISGRHAIDLNYSPPSIVDWAVPMIRQTHFSGICDRRLVAHVDPTVIRQLGLLAAKCVRPSSEKRPDIAEVVECLKVVSKRARSPLIWKSIRRRVGCVERSLPSVKYEVSEEVVKGNGGASRIGSRRNRKVSSVPGVQLGCDHQAVGWVSDRVVRSRSVGSFTSESVEMSSVTLNRVGSDLVKRRPNVAVKMPLMRLSKSRSMGVLQSPRLVQVNNGGFVIGFGKFGNYNISNSTEFHVSKLVNSISLDEKSENEMLEKPLVLS